MLTCQVCSELCRISDSDAKGVAVGTGAQMPACLWEFAIQGRGGVGVADSRWVGIPELAECKKWEVVLKQWLGWEGTAIIRKAHASCRRAY